MVDINYFLDYESEDDEVYGVDFLPYTSYSDDFYEIEDYFLENYLREYTQKIIYIFLKLSLYYDTKVYISEPCSEMRFAKKFKKFRKHTADKLCSNIKEFSSIQEIVNLIRYSRKGNISLEILFNDEFLFSLGSEFNVAFYNIPADKLEMVEKIVSAEGLFLRKTQ